MSHPLHSSSSDLEKPSYGEPVHTPNTPNTPSNPSDVKNDDHEDETKKDWHRFQLVLKWMPIAIIIYSTLT